METATIFSQMAQYNFKNPINVTMIFEESDDEDSNNRVSSENGESDNIKPKLEVLKDEANTENSDMEYEPDIIITYIPDKENISHEPNTISGYTSEKENLSHELNTISSPMSEKENIQHEDVINNLPAVTNINESTNLNSDMPILDSETSIIEGTDQEKHTEANSNVTHSERIQGLLTQDTIQKSPHIPEKNLEREKDELTAYIKDLLNTLSEHLIIVMKYYYFYYNQNPTPDLMARLDKIKKHFYDLSYSTLVTIVLPQEKNESFAKTFINKTICDSANHKIFPWKCSPRHVEPFYNEMIEWAKQKRENIRALTHRNNNNNNEILKEQLGSPQQTPNFPQQIEATNRAKDRVGDNKKKSMCIFSTNAPGGEIRINVDAEALMKCNALKRPLPKSCKNKRAKRYDRAPIVHPPPKQTHYNQFSGPLPQNYYSQNTTGYQNPVSRPPPPSYNYTVHQNNNCHSLNTIQENIRNTYQNMEIHRNTSQPYGTPAYNYANNAHNFFHGTQAYNNIQMYNGLTTPTPVISHVSSLNPSMDLTTDQCCICGKRTALRCSKCNRMSYCSYLCQELNSDVHKYVCGKR